MEWSEIRRRHPGKFVLLGDVEEQRMDAERFRVRGGTVLLATDDPQMLFKAYRERKGRGENVIYALPATPEEFIVEEKAILGVLG